MKLYGSLTSPFVRKCRITAIESGVTDQLDFHLTVVMDDKSVHPNPLKMVPSLETNEGELIVDSRVISAYIAAQGTGLAEGSSWADQTLVAMADGLTDRAVSMTLEGRRPTEERSAKWIQRCEGAIRATLPELERRCPTAFTPGAIALTCALGYLDFRFDRLNWRDGVPKLAAWYEAQLKRPSVRDTEPPR